MPGGLFLNNKKNKTMMAFFKHPLIKEGAIEYREYQDILAKRVLERGNTLVVLPTGLGKTIIAILVAVNKLDEGKVLFLAPTKPLANQHLKSFDRLTEIKELGLLTGEIKDEERRKILDSSRVVFATPQTIQNMIISGEINLREFSLVIFDEAHRAVGDYAYVFIADRYNKENKAGLILGITASPGGTREKIQEIIQNLFIKNVEVKTEKDESVRRYIPGKKESWVVVELPPEMKEIRDIARSQVKDILGKLKENDIIRSKIGKAGKKALLELQSDLISNARLNPSLYAIIPKVNALIKLNHAIELLETQGLVTFKIYLEKLGKDKSKGASVIKKDPRFAKMLYLADKSIKQGIEHPKLDKLVQVVKERGKQTIVFTQYRASAKHIEEKLEANGISCSRFIGQTSRNGEKGMRQKEQAEMIEKFRNKEFQVLIATSIGEEGIDIPSVDLVVFYEPVPSEIRKIQRSGRTGRKSPGEVVYLITKGTRDEAFYWSSKHKEREMERTLAELSEYDTKLQKSLAEYITIKQDNPTVFVDRREIKSGIPKILREMGVTVKEITLEVGDYLISERVVVERKSANDFINSIIDGRLFDQAINLVNNFQRPIVIIEGRFPERGMHPNSIRGAIASLVMDYGISVFQTKDQNETAEFLAIMAKRELKGGGIARLRGEKKPLTDKELQLYLVEGLPGVGPELARRLLEKFKTVEKVFTASEKDLKGIDKLGEKKAKEIRRILGKEWGKE